MKVVANFWVERGGQEVDLIVRGVYYPEQEGRLNGPPEDCYPPESDDAEILAVTLADGTPFTEALSTDEENRAKDALLLVGRNL